MTPTTLMFCKEGDANFIRCRRQSVSRNRTNRYMLIILLTLLTLFFVLLVCLLWRFFYMDKRLESKLLLHDQEILYLERNKAAREAIENLKGTDEFDIYANEIIEPNIKIRRSKRARRSLDDEQIEDQKKERLFRKQIQDLVREQKNRRKRADWFINLREVMDLYIKVRHNLNSANNKKDNIGNKTVAEAFVKSVDKYLNKGENIFLNKRETNDENNEETSESVFPNNIPFTDNELEEKKTEKGEIAKTTTTTSKPENNKISKKVITQKTTTKVPTTTTTTSTTTTTITTTAKIKKTKKKPKKTHSKPHKTITEPIVDRQREIISKWLSSELAGISLQESTETTISYPTPKPYEFKRTAKKISINRVTTTEAIEHKETSSKNNTKLQNNTSSTLEEILFPNKEYNQLQETTSENNKYMNKTTMVVKNLTSNIQKSEYMTSNIHLENTAISGAKRTLNSANEIKASIAAELIESTQTRISKAPVLPHITSSLKSIMHVSKTKMMTSSLSKSSSSSKSLTKTSKILPTITPTKSLYLTPSSTLRPGNNASQELEDYFTSVELQTTPTDFETLKREMEEKINTRNKIIRTTPSLYLNASQIKSNRSEILMEKKSSTYALNIIQKSVSKMHIRPTLSIAQASLQKKNIIESNHESQSLSTHNIQDSMATMKIISTKTINPTKSIYAFYRTSAIRFNATDTRSTIAKPVRNQSIEIHNETKIQQVNTSGITENNSSLVNSSINMEMKQQNLTSNTNMTSNNSTTQNNETVRSTINKHTDYEFVTLTTEATTRSKRQTEENKISTKHQKETKSTKKKPTPITMYSITKEKSAWRNISITPMRLTTPLTILQKNTSQSVHDKIEEILKKNKNHELNTKLEGNVLKFLKNILHKLNKHEITISSRKEQESSSEKSTELSWKCRNVTTDWATDYIVGTSRFLSNHKIKCSNDEFLQEFQLVDNKDQFFPLFRYNYKCCRLMLKRRH